MQTSTPVTLIKYFFNDYRKMKPSRTLAQLAIYRKPDKDSDFALYSQYDLISHVVRIGRSAECEITLDDGSDLFRAVSRRHATLFYYPHESDDYQIMDGVVNNTSPENPNPQIIPSRTGLYLNGHKLPTGIKQPLKHNDEIFIIPNRLKFIYLRPQTKVMDKLKDTYIPEEYVI